MPKKGFDISEVFGDLTQAVPESGTEQIQQIPMELIDSDERNFYELSGIDELASNIATVGLLDPIRVRATEDGRYTIVSGHRRRAAMAKLLEEGHPEFAEVPCIVSTSTDSPELEELKLIFANSDTRKMTPGDISRQSQRVERLLYDLKEQGFEFPGRMRDYVAKACNVSKTKLSNVKVIRERLSDSWMPYYDSGKLAEATALALTKSPKELQEYFYKIKRKATGESMMYLWESSIEALQTFCDTSAELQCWEMGGIRCQNHDRKLEKFASTIFRNSYADRGCAGRCCSDCAELGTCKAACPMMAKKAQEIKAKKKAEKKETEDAQKAKDEKTKSRLAQLWRRFGKARKASGLSLEEYLSRVGTAYYSSYLLEEWTALENGAKTPRTTERIPFLESWDRLQTVDNLVQAADALGCSLDYLCCRTDVPEMADQAPKKPRFTGPHIYWHPGQEPPRKPHKVLAKFETPEGLQPALCRYEDEQWYICWQTTRNSGTPDIDSKFDEPVYTQPVCWAEYEEDDSNDE